jgi:hypothetical protein
MNYKSTVTSGGNPNNVHAFPVDTYEINCLLLTFQCLDQLISLEVGLASLNSSLLAMSAQVPLAVFPLILPFS